MAHSRPLNADNTRVAPEEARLVARQLNVSVVELAMLGDRPVYRFGNRRPVTVFADRPEVLARISSEQARTLARQYAPDAPSLVTQGHLSSPDQWTLQLLAHFPLYQFSLGDDRKTEIYVSSKTGDVVMCTTRRQRMLAFLGPIAHWLYVPVLRRNGPLWTNVVVWSSGTGCVLCLSSLLVGVPRSSRSRAFSSIVGYHGLHSLDPAWLRNRRPLWDVLVVGLSLGGIVGVATSLIPAWCRIRRV